MTIKQWVDRWSAALVVVALLANAGCAVALIGAGALGGYAISLGSDGEGGVNGDITDIDGVLDLRGRIQLSLRQLEFDGSVRSDLPEELDRFFRVVGRAENERYMLHWQKSFDGR